MRQKLATKTQLKLQPHLVLSSTLLEASADEIEERIHREVETNPALLVRSRDTSVRAGGRTQAGRAAGREAAHGYQSRFGNADEIDWVEMLPSRTTILDKLVSQVSLIAEAKDQDALIFLLGELDQHGYLRATSEELAEVVGRAEEEVEGLVRILHELEPPGVGARDLRECLLIQCDHISSQGADCALVRRVLTEGWIEFVEQAWGRLARKLGVTRKEIIDVQQYVRNNFYPYPLLMAGDDEVELTDQDADLIIVQQIRSDAEMIFEVVVPEAQRFEVRVDENHKYALEAITDGVEHENRTSFYECLDRARLFVIALQRRWSMLRRIGGAVIRYQRAFLKGETASVCPMSRCDLARELGIHLSTLNRAIHGKCIMLMNGRRMMLNEFFDGTVVIKRAIHRLLIKTGIGYSDREISEHLQSEGVHVARRTVAKYRHQIMTSRSWQLNLSS